MGAAVGRLLVLILQAELFEIVFIIFPFGNWKSVRTTPVHSINHYLSGLLFILLLLILLTGSYAQNPASAQNQEDPYAELRRRIVQPPKVTDLGSSVVRVPMVGTKTLPLIEVKINGKGPYKFLFDTGANVTILQTRVIEELKLLNLKPVGKPILELKDLQIGNAHFRELLVAARDWDEKIDGVLGFSVFADCLLTIDYPKQKFILRQGTIPKANGKDIFNYLLLADGGLPGIEATFGNESIRLLIDTGSSKGVIVSEKFASKLSFANGFAAGPNMETVATPKSRSKIGKLAGNMQIGIHRFIQPTIYVRNEEFPTIGSKILQDFVLTFDQKNKSVRISV